MGPLSGSMHFLFSGVYMIYPDLHFGVSDHLPENPIHQIAQVAPRGRPRSFQRDSGSLPAGATCHTRVHGSVQFTSLFLRNMVFHRGRLTPHLPERLCTVASGRSDGATPWEALKQKNQTVKSFSALELGKGEGPDRHVVVGCLVFSMFLAVFLSAWVLPRAQRIHSRT